MAYSSVTMARFIVAKANSAGYIINMTKLQKLLFIVYGVALAISNEKIINDECPQAWPYGPVFPRSRSELMEINLSNIDINHVGDPNIQNDNFANNIVSMVLNAFGKWNASMLVTWTHRDGSPWSSTTKLPNFKWSDIIPDDYIRTYFKSILMTNNNA